MERHILVLPMHMMRINANIRMVIHTGEIIDIVIGNILDVRYVRNIK